MGISQKIPYLKDLTLYTLRISTIYASFFLLSRCLPINLVLAGIFAIFIAQHLSNTTKLILITAYFFSNYALAQSTFSEFSTIAIYSLLSIALTLGTLLDLNIKLKKELEKQHHSP